MLCVRIADMKGLTGLYASSYIVSGCSQRASSYCGVFTRVDASCANCMSNCNHCPGFDQANGNTDPTLCDGAPAYQKGGTDGPVLYRVYENGYTKWYLSSSNALESCYSFSPAYKSQSNHGLGYAPTAPAYGSGCGGGNTCGWFSWSSGDDDCYSYCIHVTVGDGR